MGERATITGSGIIDGTDGDDVIVGSGAIDTITGKRGDDLVCGGGGEDQINGGPGTDELDGGPGDDRLRGDINLPRGRGLAADGGDDDVLYGAPAMTAWWGIARATLPPAAGATACSAAPGTTT